MKAEVIVVGVASLVVTTAALARLAATVGPTVPPPTRLALGGPLDGVGEILPRAMTAKIVDRRKPVLIAMMSDCSSCSLKAVYPGVEPPNRFSVVFFVSDRPESEWPDRFRRLSPPYYIVRDGKRDLFRRISANWTPRLYIADADGRITQAEVGIGDEHDFRK